MDIDQRHLNFSDGTIVTAIGKSAEYISQQLSELIAATNADLQLISMSTAKKKTYNVGDDDDDKIESLSSSSSPPPLQRRWSVMFNNYMRTRRAQNRRSTTMSEAERECGEDKSHKWCWLWCSSKIKWRGLSKHIKLGIRV